MKAHVAVLAGASIGGTEKAASIFAAELAKRGYLVDFICEEGPQTEFLRRNGVRIFSVGYEVGPLVEYLRAETPPNTPPARIWVSARPPSLCRPSPLRLDPPCSH